MIYRERLFKKELRRSYLNSLSGGRRQFFMCVLMTLLTFAAHMLLRLAFEIVLTEYLPALTPPGSFSVAYSCNLTAYIFYIVYLSVKPDAGVLSELRDNKWYLFSKMGYKADRIIFFKTLVSLSSAVSVYAACFVTVSAISYALKYYFFAPYFLPFLVSGVLGVLLCAELLILSSLLSGGNNKTTRLIFLSALIINEVLKFTLGYYRLIGDEALMQNTANLFLPRYSLYCVIMAILVLILPLFFNSAIRRKSGYYLLKNEIGGIVSCGEQVFIGPDELDNVRKGSPLAIMARVILAFVLFASLICNSFILTASLSSSSREFSIFGYIPYVFRSATMEPLIRKNDLALFKKIDSQYPISVGDVVLFKSSPGSTEISVMKVTEVRDGNLTVDYLKYPIVYTPGSLKESVSRGKVYGVFYASNHIWGTIILLINTLPGRVLTILLPAAFLIFPKQLLAFLRRPKKAE